MNGFGVLTNGKRALIALVHSVVFLLIATAQLLMFQSAGGMLGVAPIAVGAWVLSGIYMIVTGILLWLFSISRGWLEKVYFALCSTSALSGLLRTILGDHTFPSARYIRVIMLGCAVLLGTAIMRIHYQIVETSS